MQEVEISVIVCTYNRDKYLEETLKHLKEQSLQPVLYEVIVVNNNSTDNTEALCKKFITNNPSLNIIYVNEINQGHSYARNRGIKEAKAPILSFIDDDAFVDYSFTENIRDFFQTHEKAIALGGKIIPVYESTEPQWMSKYLLPLVAALDMGSSVKLFKGRKFPIGANMAFRAYVFDRYGLFNVNLGRKGAGLEGGDEKEVFLRLKKNQEFVYYVPQVLVQHIIPDKRVTPGYIKGLAVGVGTSEKTRLKNDSLVAQLQKGMQELLKFFATIILAFKYFITFRPSKAKMLIKFRFWVWKGLLS